MRARPTYAVDAPDQIVIEPLGMIDTLYHRRSGTTHLVAAPIPQILEALAQGPANLPTLIERLSARFDLEDEATPALKARLAELVALGLVRRAAR